MAIHQIEGVDDYVHYIRENPIEAELLFKELLIGVTCFFRDPEVWQHVKQDVLPALLGFPLRASVPLSTSQETSVRSANAASASLQALSDQLLLKKFAPPAMLVTVQGDIVYFSGKTAKYLAPPAGKANLNLFAMLRPSLRQPVSDLFYRAVRQKVASTLDAVALVEDGSGSAVRVSVEPLQEPKAFNGMLMVVFSDIVTVPFQAEKSVNAAPGEAGHDARVAGRTRHLVPRPVAARPALRTEASGYAGLFARFCFGCPRPWRWHQRCEYFCGARTVLGVIAGQLEPVQHAGAGGFFKRVVRLFSHGEATFKLSVLALTLEQSPVEKAGTRLAHSEGDGA